MTIEGAYQQIKEWELPFYVESSRKKVLETIEEYFDAVPVVHGKWMHDNYGVNFCSECLKFAYEDEEYRMIWHTNFCPHCGAKMDEKDGENNEN